MTAPADGVVDRAGARRADPRLVTHRPEFVAPWHDRPRVMPMILTRLERRDSDRLIEQVVGDVDLPEAVRDKISLQTDGVPLFIEELTKTVLETSADRERAKSAIAIPASLKDSLEARLDRLAQSAQLAIRRAVSPSRA